MKKITVTISDDAYSAIIDTQHQLSKERGFHQSQGEAVTFLTMKVKTIPLPAPKKKKVSKK